MKRARWRRDGKSGLDLIEEATHLLRTAPAATLATYYLGTIPFTLGLLYFWADMSRSPFATQHLAEAALAMAALFLWMKCCQAVFARRIRAQVTGEPLPPLSLRRCGRIFLTQAIVQPSGLFLLPVSLVFVFPVVWVYAFYQNATVLADREPGEKFALIRHSVKHAALWPVQNLSIFLILLAFTFYIFVNWTIASISVPGLVKMLLGIESEFTKSPWSMVNTTFFMAMFVLTWLCVDPILKVIYTLRCFYGESLQTGDDLKAGLKQFAAAVQPLTAMVVLFIALCGLPSARGGEAAPPPVLPLGSGSAPGVSPPDLDRAIDDTIHQRKFTWRMPRERVVTVESDKGVITRFLEKVGGMVRKWARDALSWLGKWLDKLFRRERPAGSQGGSGYGWIMALQVLFYLLIAAAIIALLFLLYRIWRGARPATVVVATEPLQSAPDLADENVGADQLPEDGWTRLARELLERGEFRLAMRAFYLASLASLAQRNLISLARFKSNREYTLELRRRGHSFPELLSVFGDNLSVFERIWYGMHDVNRDLVDRFATNVERIRTGA